MYNIIEHFINENDDVLVSLDETIPDGFYRIPYIEPFTIAQIAVNKSLFIVAKCYSLAFKEFKEPTEAMTIKKWLNANGFEYNGNYFNNEYYLAKIGYYKEYTVLSLSTLYGANYRKFKLIKPFIIPKEYIKECYDNYNSEKIKAYINNLISEGFIEIENY